MDLDYRPLGDPQGSLFSGRVDARSRRCAGVGQSRLRTVAGVPTSSSGQPSFFYWAALLTRLTVRSTSLRARADILRHSRWPRASRAPRWWLASRTTRVRLLRVPVRAVSICFSIALRSRRSWLESALRDLGSSSPRRLDVVVRRVFFRRVFFAAFFRVVFLVVVFFRRVFFAAFFRVAFFAAAFFRGVFLRVVDFRAVTFGPPLCSIRGLGLTVPSCLGLRALCNTSG